MVLKQGIKLPGSDPAALRSGLVTPAGNCNLFLTEVVKKIIGRKKYIKRLFINGIWYDSLFFNGMHNLKLVDLPSELYKGAGQAGFTNP